MSQLAKERIIYLKRKPYSRKVDSAFKNGSNFVSIATILILLEKVLGSLSRVWQFFHESHAPCTTGSSSSILGLSNEVKHISELQVAFEKTAKNLTKFASKNLGVRKLNFPNVSYLLLFQILENNSAKNFFFCEKIAVTR